MIYPLFTGFWQAPTDRWFQTPKEYPNNAFGWVSYPLDPNMSSMGHTQSVQEFSNDLRVFYLEILATDRFG